MKLSRTCHRLATALLCAAMPGLAADCPPPLRPIAVTNVLNAASHKPGISPNSLFTIYGHDFASAGFSRQVRAEDLVNGRFPTQFSCIAVEFDGERVPILFVSTVQINAQAPTRPLPNPVRVTVIRNPGQPDEVRVSWDGVQTQAYSPAFFTFDGQSIATLSRQYEIISDPSKPPFGRFARPGEIVLLYANGFGYTQPVWQAGEITDRVSWLRDPVQISIGGVVLAPQDIYYTGLAGAAISGLYQFNVRIPDFVQEGEVPVVIRIGGFQTQPEAMLPIRK